MNPYEYNSDDIKELLTCTGWAFAETEENNDDKAVYVILKGHNKSFISRSAIMKSDDIHLRFPEWKQLQGGMNNFSISISTVILPPDSYEIYLYVEENRTNRGLIDIGQSFIKNGIRLSEGPRGTEIDKVDLIDIKGNLDKGWVNINKTAEWFKVSGWLIKTGVVSEDMSYYIVINGENEKNVILSVPNLYRTDVAESLGDTIYMGSGFAGQIEIDKLPDSHGKVYIIAENEGLWYTSNSYEYDITK